MLSLRVLATTCLCLPPLAAQGETPMRAVLESPGGDLPFIMTENLVPVAILNGSERIELPAAERSRDGLLVRLPPYDSALQLRRDGKRWLGTWRKQGPAGEVALPLRWEPWPAAETSDADGPMRQPLFPLRGEPFDVAGRWRVTFGSSDDPAVAVFAPSRGSLRRMPGEITGTFLTTTGDYRYLAGTARGRKLRLSCFDGAHAFLFHAQLQDDGSLAGDFWSGNSWHETWTAVRDEAAALPDAFTLTTITQPDKLGDLRFPDIDGDIVRVGDQFGAATLVMLFGTWCPNCSDAGVEFRRLRDQFGDRGLRVLGLAFEHGDDHERHRRVLADYRKTRRIDWPILLAGSSDKRAASAAFPVLDAVRSFPTTLFVDADGTIRAVHQGFYGPATGEAFLAQRQRFAALTDKLLTEAGR